MVTAVAPVRTSATRARSVSMPVAPRPSALHARPIPVAAYPADTPRWITYDGRRHRVVAVYEQPSRDPRLDFVPYGARRLEAELDDGRVLTLLHHGRSWYERNHDDRQG